MTPEPTTNKTAALTGKSVRAQRAQRHEGPAVPMTPAQADALMRGTPGGDNTGLLTGRILEAPPERPSRNPFQNRAWRRRNRANERRLNRLVETKTPK